MPQKMEFPNGRLLSRRTFVGEVLAGAGLLVLGPLSCVSTFRDDTPHRITRSGGLVSIPARGELVVASDFHARCGDFLRWLRATRLVERLRSGEDVYGLLLGDVVDRKLGDKDSAQDGDSRIVEQIREIQNGPGGERLILLQGNHEQRVVQVYDELEQHYGLKPSNQQAVVQEYYQRDPSGRELNFLERITPQQRAYLADLPLAVLTASGLVATHAGPSSTARNIEDIINREPAVCRELLFGRPKPVLPIEDQYCLDDTTRFLRMMNNADVLVTGHTPFRKLPEGWVSGGIGRYGRHQVILDTAAGDAPGANCYLALDLKKRYRDTRSIRPYDEIRRLDG